MKKRVVHTLFFVLLTTFLVLSALKVAFAPAPPQTFNVEVVIANVAPRIHNISINGGNPAFSVAPVENGTRNVAVVFNVSDTNGQADIVDGTLQVVINFTTTTKLNTTGCTLLTTGTNDKKYNCSLNFFYFDENATTYDLNVSARDAAAAQAVNFTGGAFTYTVLTAIELTDNVLTFTGEPGANNVRGDDQIIRNTGNDQFRRINVTGFDLIGATQVLGATNFTVNVTNTTDGNFRGVTMANGTNVSFSNTTLWLARANNSNFTIFFALNISAALTDTTFNNTRVWEMRVDRV